MSRSTPRRFLALGAAAGVLASSALVVAPAAATSQPAPGDTPRPAAGSDRAASSPSGTALSADALAEAVQRDLGLTPEQFAAAGELATRAAAAAAQLRDVPGYAGIRLRDGAIVASGAGADFSAAVAALAGAIPELAVETPPDPAPADASAGSAKAAANPGSELALSTEQLFQAYLAEVGLQGLQAVMDTGDKFVIRTGGINAPESTAESPALETGPALGTSASTPSGAGEGKVSPAEFASRFANVELDVGAPVALEAEVPGGVGYQADTGWICSTGFAAFDPAGLPAVLTAGHCASDGAATTAELLLQGVPAGHLGSFQFSQFGGPDNSPVLNSNAPTGPGNIALADPGNVGTDIAVIGSLRPDLDPLPAASTWGDPTQAGPDVKVVGTSEPVVGMPVCRSGRTSAWSCGTVDAVGIFLVPGPDYVAPTEGSDPAAARDLRAFNGFLSYGVQSSGGDSGGPYVSGNYAVGTHAAGDAAPEPDQPPPPNFAVGATLADSLAVLPGYQLELFLNKPAVMSPAPGETYEPGQVISGSVPAAPAAAVAAGSAVRITPDGQEPFELPVNSDGSWSFQAPESGTTLRFSAETINGFSASGAASFEFHRAAEHAAESTNTESTNTGSTNTALTNPDRGGSAAAPAGPSRGGDAAAVVPAPVQAPPARLPDTGNNASRNLPRSGDLANTGFDALPAAGAAVGAITAGALLIALVRRRQQLHT